MHKNAIIFREKKQYSADLTIVQVEAHRVPRLLSVYLHEIS